MRQTPFNGATHVFHYVSPVRLAKRHGHRRGTHVRTVYVCSRTARQPSVAKRIDSFQDSLIENVNENRTDRI